MENPRTTRPAASNGSLNAAYNAQARLGSLSSAGSRRHLHSVHENAALLPSPGPLESMLKTTTETGDIGVFSIRPIASSSTFNHLPRERSAYWDDTPRPRRRSESGDSRRHAPPRTHVQDDRRRLPSYQDAASDIISMYEPETQQPAHSLLPPPFDDQGLRSYSMTSYGSKTYSQRAPARHHHGGTMPPFLQRPRSPYPYPTRLKRPGVRPSSPALTVNGNVDYSRMIGIDRVSHRTDHHRVLRPQQGYGQGGRRGPPPSLRPEAARSMRSYSSHGSYRSQRTSSSTGPDYRGRYHHPRPAHPWAIQSTEASDYSTHDSKFRNSSFGSIIDKYQYSSSAAAHPPDPKAPSRPFYYDYSEDFDSERHDYDTLRTRSPLVPVSAHVANSRRSPVPTDGWRSRSKPRHAPSPSSFSTPRTDDNSENNSDHYGRLVSEYIPVVPNSTPVQVESLPSKPHFDPESVIEILISENKQRVDSELSRSLHKQQAGNSSLRSSNQQADHEAPAPETRGSTSSTSRNEDDSQDLRAPHTLSGRLSPAAGSSTAQATDSTESSENAASPVGVTTNTYRDSDTTVSGHISSWVPSDHEMAHRSSGTMACSQSATSRCLADGGRSARRVRASDTMREHISTIFFDQSEPEADPAFGYDRSHGGGNNRDHQRPLERHRREGYGLLRYTRINGRVERDSASVEISPARSETPMLAPKPISPAKELRVRNSIPQLIKALPALPGDHSPPANSSIELCGEDSDEDGRSTVQILSISTPRSKKKEGSVVLGPETRMRQIDEEAELQPKVSKLKLRVSSPGSGSPRQEDASLSPGSPDSCEVVPSSSLDGNVTSTRSTRCRKIKLKIPKNTPTEDNTAETGTTKRASIVGTSTGLLETPESNNLVPGTLAMSSLKKASPSDIGKSLPFAERGHGRARLEDTASLPPSPSPCHAEIREAARGVSLDINPVAPLLSSTETVVSPEHDGGPSPSAASNMQKQGPRRRFSNIRLRLTESLSRRTGREVSGQALEGGGDQAEGNNVCRTALGAADSQSDLFKDKPAPASKKHRTRSKSRVRNKLSKLVKGARHAMKTYIRKRHRAS
ncbi:hypothetical protein MAPG_02622 [Magnaporthiopsis poae ATCC 64411]|uniref:Uncharacterized protein n=1 Tax=Magnaporthiopsis poae (strain ATCC 64411 / 73-15) TaxID=644358 RepID=A0A0C4DRV5_MAGP6|nr:hypothetical protein MAPG_02622 [Magnaporthiopsis poae ATCC 64411]